MTVTIHSGIKPANIKLKSWSSLKFVPVRSTLYILCFLSYLFGSVSIAVIFQR